MRGIMKIKTQFFIIGLLVCLLIVSPELQSSELIGISQDSKWGEIRSTGKVVNIRSDRSTRSRIVGKLNPGDKVKVDFFKYGWYAIFDVDETIREEAAALGYVAAYLLKPIQVRGAISDDWGNIMYVDKRVNIRKERNTKSSIVGKLSPGEKVKADFLKNDWYAIFNPDETVRDEATALGYVYTYLLKSVAEESLRQLTFAEKQLKSALQDDWGELQYAEETVNIRSDRDKSSRIVGKLNAGDQVKVDFLQNDWYAVFDPEETVKDEAAAIGYVFAPLLSSVASPIVETDALFELEPDLEEPIDDLASTDDILLEEEEIDIIPEQIIDEKDLIDITEGEASEVLTVSSKEELAEEIFVSPTSPKTESIGDPLLPIEKMKIFGFSGEYSSLSFDNAYDSLDGDGSGDIDHYATGGNLFFGYDNWMVNLFYRTGNWTNPMKAYDEGEEYDYDLEQDVEEWEITLRYLPKRSDSSMITPYLLVAYNNTELKETKTLEEGLLSWPDYDGDTSNNLQIMEEDAKYQTILLGLGTSIPFNKYIGVRCELSAAYTMAEEISNLAGASDKSGEGFGSTAMLSCYWNIYKGLNLEIGTRYNEWNGGSEIGGISKRDALVVNLGYSKTF